ncbi:MAG: molybdopterin-dependent oxidoreductase [Hyphomicrobiales bacterium]|nr:molybdopterin-dependent oxidoreductase [Hyphomicrobiales bacterium]MCP5373798.1 molybdopterin-dependent oxidoreductase [Hyphomicrobiales bacterium]
MTDGNWKRTACILCYANCGLEVKTDGGRITTVRGDRAHPRSRGYLCQKAQGVAHYARPGERLTTPLRRRADGGFETVDWDTALDEIAARLRAVVDAHGPVALGHYGGGGQGNHSGGGYGIMMLRALGARNFYSALSQEKSGRFWVNGRMYGAQTCNHIPLAEDADLWLVIGSSVWEAQCEPGARVHVREFAKEADRRMIVVDPVRTREAEMADLHLQIKPGTDAFLMGAMLKMLVERGAQDDAFIAAHCDGWPAVRESILAIPAPDWIAATGLDPADVERAVDMVAASRAMALRTELGIEQSRNSTLNSYLGNLLFLVTGHFGRPGTHAIHSWLQPLFGNSRGAVSPVTGMLEIAGLYPPNRFPAEVLTDHPDRLRAMIVDSSNPANSAADTDDVERAFRALDLLVVVDVAMTETAALADYVLPAAAQYEKWEFTYFTFTFPTNYFHLRRPLFEPFPGTRPEPEIYADLARRLGLLPDADVIAGLRETAGRDRAAFAAAFQGLLREDKRLFPLAPVILYLTLGKSLANGAASTAILWPACHRLAQAHTVPVQRALGTEAPPPLLGEMLFETIVNADTAVPFTTHTFDEMWDMVPNPGHRFQLDIPEMRTWMAELRPDGAEAAGGDYPFIVSLGQRRSHNANQIVRHPGWRKKDLDGALRVHPADLADLGAADGGWVTVETRRGRLTARAEADDRLRRGYAALPHGYGMRIAIDPESGWDGAGNDSSVLAGPRINRLSASDDCDPLTATPYHKTVAARLTRASNEEAARSEDQAAQLRRAL